MTDLDRGRRARRIPRTGAGTWTRIVELSRPTWTGSRTQVAMLIGPVAIAVFVQTGLEARGSDAGVGSAIYSAASSCICRVVMLFPCRLCCRHFLRLLLHFVFFCDQTRVVQILEEIIQIFEKLSPVDDHPLPPLLDDRGCMGNEKPHSTDIIHLLPYKVPQSLSNKSTNHDDKFNDLARPFLAACLGHEYPSLAALLALEYPSLAALVNLSHFPMYPVR